MEALSLFSLVQALLACDDAIVTFKSDGLSPSVVHKASDDQTGAESVFFDAGRNDITAAELGDALEKLDAFEHELTEVKIGRSAASVWVRGIVGFTLRVDGAVPSLVLIERGT